VEVILEEEVISMEIEDTVEIEVDMKKEGRDMVANGAEVSGEIGVEEDFKEEVPDAEVEQ
jgi:hypothetical protein